MNLFLHGASDFPGRAGRTRFASRRSSPVTVSPLSIASSPIRPSRSKSGGTRSGPAIRTAGTSPACRRQERRLRLVQHMISRWHRPPDAWPSSSRTAPYFRMGKEGEMRKKILQMDLLEAVIGLGPNLFYGTGLAACVLVFRQRKKKDRKKKVLIIDASASLRRAGPRTSYCRTRRAYPLLAPADSTFGSRDSLGVRPDRPAEYEGHRILK